jgi:hypothetical protein
MIDPNYVKLFKISQLTIEYLMVRFEFIYGIFFYKINFLILNYQNQTKKKHSQTYLTDVIGTVETQLESTHLVRSTLFNKTNTKINYFSRMFTFIFVKDADKYKKLTEKIQKELVETKKENKKRKKMIETQQTLLNANTSNYHQVSFLFR